MLRKDVFRYSQDINKILGKFHETGTSDCNVQVSLLLILRKRTLFRLRLPENARTKIGA